MANDNGELHPAAERFLGQLAGRKSPLDKLQIVRGLLEGLGDIRAEALMELRDQGMPVREIAEVAGVGYVWVYELIRRQESSTQGEVRTTR